MKPWILLSLVLIALAASAAQEVEQGCKRLRIALDTGLTAVQIEQEWGSGNPRSEAQAKLELIGCNGQLLDSLVLAAAMAQIDPQPILGAPNPTYLISADLTIDAGSYNGPLTIPIQIIDDHLVAVTARLTDNRFEPIRLTLTGKSAWRRISNRNAEDFLLVSSQPKGKGFETIYRRYFLADHEWNMRQRTLNGLWESDGEFPSRTLFP